MKPYESTPPIHQWAEEDRPREKMLNSGATALSNAELLALLISTGSRKESAVALCQRILQHSHNNLIALSKMTLDELMMFEGIGSAKAIAIAAALELGRRRRYAEALVRPQIRSSKEAFEAIQGYLSDKNFEEFWILLLNRANKVLRALQISEGGVAGTVADPKKIFSLALSNRASGLILCHNHPSGNLQPSEADRSLTRKLVKAGEYIELPVLDHLIIGEENYYSFADEGLL